MSPNIKDDRVLALKYRPEKFEDLIGQNTISQTLSLALDSKIPNLRCRGFGKEI